MLLMSKTLSLARENRNEPFSLLEKKNPAGTDLSDFQILKSHQGEAT